MLTKCPFSQHPVQLTVNCYSASTLFLPIHKILLSVISAIPATHTRTRFAYTLLTSNAMYNWGLLCVMFESNKSMPKHGPRTTFYSRRRECDDLYSWITKRSHMQNSHPKWWTPEIQLGTQKKKPHSLSESVSVILMPILILLIVKKWLQTTQVHSHLDACTLNSEYVSVSNTTVPEACYSCKHPILYVVCMKTYFFTIT